MTSMIMKLGTRHKLEVSNILNVDGTLQTKRLQILVGEDRFIARKMIASELKELSSLEKVSNDYKSHVGHSEGQTRSIEPNFPCNGSSKWRRITLNQHWLLWWRCDSTLSPEVQKHVSVLEFGKCPWTGVFPANSGGIRSCLLPAKWRICSG